MAQRGDHAEGRVSIVIDDDEILNADSDKEDDDEAHSRPDPFEAFTQNGLVLGCGNGLQQKVIQSFVTGMGPRAKDIKLMALHSNMSFPDSMVTKKARYDAHMIFEQAMARKCGGNPNGCYAWYGASREEICQIISHGFSRCNGETAADGVSHGVGIYLYPVVSHPRCMASSVADENGLRHVLFCHAILGKMEVIPAGSKQIQPGSMEFDSGVDNLSVPRRYIVWSAFMNSHIFPTYIISFKDHDPNDLNRNQVRPIGPYLAQLNFAGLFDLLSRTLNPAKRPLLSKCYADFQENKITQQQAMQRMVQITGDVQLLRQIVNSEREKRINKGFGSNRK